MLIANKDDVLGIKKKTSSDLDDFFSFEAPKMTSTAILSIVRVKYQSDTVMCADVVDMMRSHRQERAI